MTTFKLAEISVGIFAPDEFGPEDDHRSSEDGTVMSLLDTMLMATHDLRLAASIARDVVFLNNGAVLEAGSARDIFTRPKRPETATFVSTLTQTLPDDWDD